MYHSEADAVSGFQIQLPAGEYKAYVDAVHYYQTKKSNVVTFSVEKAVPYTVSTVKKNGTVHTVETEIHNIDESCEVINAGYKDGVLVTLKREPYSGSNTVFMLDGDIDEVKVMVWDSLSKIRPLCEFNSLKSTEFITE